MDPNADALLLVSQQLASLQMRVQELARASAARAAASPPPPPPPADKPALKRAMSLEAATSEDEALAYVRPSHYKHKPENRPDTLEAEGWHETPLMDALRLDSFQGFYNLALFLLVFAIMYLTIRSFREKGSQLTLDDFTCPELQRDIKDAAAAAGCCFAFSASFFLALQLWIYRRITWRSLLLLYASLQTVLVMGPVLFIYSRPIAPMPAAAVLMIALVLALKVHSYIFTNLGIYQEHIKRYGTSLLEANKSPSGGSSASASGSGSAATPTSKKAGVMRTLPGPPLRANAAGDGDKDKDSDADDAGEPDIDDDLDAAGGASSARKDGGDGLSALPPKPASARRRKGKSSRSSRGVTGSSAGANDADAEDTAEEGDSGAVAGKAGSAQFSSPRTAFLQSKSQRPAEAFALNGSDAVGTASAASPADVAASPAVAAPVPTPATWLSGGLRAPTMRSPDAPDASSSSPPSAAVGDAALVAGAAAVPGDLTGLAGSGGVAGGPAVQGVGTGSAAGAGAHMPASQRRQVIRTWPHNVTMRDFAYFVAAPTLVYEPKFPRVRRRRWGFILRKSIEAVLCLVVQYVLMRQFMLPVLQAPAVKPPSAAELDPSASSLQRMVSLASSFMFDQMKLAIPSMIVWLTGFYAIFHCWCGILAELLRFADRTFYLDFWNATTIDAFWRKWNVPVHEWCWRHTYLDLVTFGQASKSQAQMATFFFSAVFHELIFSVAFKTLRPWFFLGMMVQMPLIFISKFFKNTRRGNYIMWLSLFTGQPLLEMLYFSEYFKTHASFFCATETPPVVQAINTVVDAISNSTVLERAASLIGHAAAATATATATAAAAGSL